MEDSDNCTHGNPIGLYCKQCGATPYEIANVIANEFGIGWLDFDKSDRLDTLTDDFSEIDRMNLCATLEREFDMKIPSGVEMKWETVDDVYKAVAAAEVQ